MVLKIIVEREYWGFFIILVNSDSALGLDTCVLSCFSHVQFLVTIRAVAPQAPLSMGILQARILEWVAVPSSRGSSPSRDWTHVSDVSHIAGRCFTTEPPEKPCLSNPKFHHKRIAIIELKISLWTPGLFFSNHECVSREKWQKLWTSQ